MNCYEASRLQPGQLVQERLAHMLAIVEHNNPADPEVVMMSLATGRRIRLYTDKMALWRALGTPMPVTPKFFDRMGAKDDPAIVQGAPGVNCSPSMDCSRACVLSPGLRDDLRDIKDIDDLYNALNGPREVKKPEPAQDLPPDCSVCIYAARREMSPFKRRASSLPATSFKCEHPDKKLNAFISSYGRNGRPLMCPLNSQMDAHGCTHGF